MKKSKTDRSRFNSSYPGLSIPPHVKGESEKIMMRHQQEMQRKPMNETMKMEGIPMAMDMETMDQIMESHFGHNMMASCERMDTVTMAQGKCGDMMAEGERMFDESRMRDGKVEMQI